MQHSRRNIEEEELKDFLDKEAEALYLNAEPSMLSFLPSAVVGITEGEWDSFCQFFDMIPNVSNKDVFQVMELARRILDDEKLDDRVLDTFKTFAGSKNMSLNEGLTHPNEWIRKLAQRCATHQKAQRRD